MAYLLKAPFSKSIKYKIWVKDLLKLMNNPGSMTETEYNPTPLGPTAQSAKVMPFIGKKYNHRTNGWHVCQQFYADCCGRTDLKSYPTPNGQVETGGNVGLTQANVQQMLAALGGDTNLLFATSMVACQLLPTSLVRLFCGEKDGMGDWGRCIVKCNGEPILIMTQYGTPVRSIKISLTQSGKPVIHCTATWPLTTTQFGMTQKNKFVTVGDLGVNSVTFVMHIVLKSSNNAVTVHTWPSYVRALFTKPGSSSKSLFSSSASPSDFEDMIEEIPDL